jgi:hypothetical protein
MTHSGSGSQSSSLWEIFRTVYADCNVSSFIERGVVAVPVKKTETNRRGDPLRWPRNTLYPQKLALLRQQAAVARSA